MFGFGKTIKEPLADAKTAERWLAAFPANDPLAIHGAVMVGLGRLTEHDAKRTPARLEAVFCVDRFADPLRKNLAAQYLEHSNRSTRVENQLWQALFDLTQGFLLCYQAFARERLVTQKEPLREVEQRLPQLVFHPRRTVAVFEILRGQILAQGVGEAVDAENRFEPRGCSLRVAIGDPTKPHQDRAVYRQRIV